MLKSRTWFSFISLALLWLFYAWMALIGTGWLGDIIAPLLAFISTAFIAWSARKAVHYSLSWLFIAIGTLFWAVAETMWGLEANLLGIDPQESILLLYLYFLPNICFLVSVLFIAFTEHRRWMSIHFLVDTIAIFFALCAFVYFVFFRGHIAILSALDHERVVSYFSVVIDTLIITFSISLFLSFNPRKIPLFLCLIFSGILLYGIVDILYVYALFNDSYYPNEFIDASYELCIALLGMGSIFFLDSPQNLQRIRTEVDSSSGLINRGVFLLLIPVLSILAQGFVFSDVVFYVAIILAHQILSRFVGLLLRRDLALRDKAEQAEYLEATISDRTRELRIMNQTLENLIKRDAITGLFNRKYFMETAEEWIAEAEPDEKLWLLILDFDRFKTINDMYGHDAGDNVLRVVGKRLETIANERTVLARLGGDEFGILCKRRKGETISALLLTLGEMVDVPVHIGLNMVHASMSIGVATWPDDARTRSDLMRHADIAMYIAKSRRVSGVSFFDNALTAGIERAHQIDLCLKMADFESEFSLVYQPQFAMGGRRLVGMEALVRWNSPTLGFVPPDEFIPVAEENGVINPLSDWIFLKALLRIADWNRRLEKRLLMGINVSPHQLDDPEFLSKLERLIDECGVLPEWVNLEFTERVAMKGETFIVEMFSALSRLNITSSIDDFGTGYSSLSYIKKFDFDYLKIAKQLIDNIVQNETDARIVQAIIMMATALNLKTIAEGVETEEQLAMLESLGCDEIQGYLLGKPHKADDFERLFLVEEEPELL